jgi:hypothetical protein
MARRAARRAAACDSHGPSPGGDRRQQFVPAHRVTSSAAIRAPRRRTSARTPSVWRDAMHRACAVRRKRPAGGRSGATVVGESLVGPGRTSNGVGTSSPQLRDQLPRTTFNAYGRSIVTGHCSIVAVLSTINAVAPDWQRAGVTRRHKAILMFALGAVASVMAELGGATDGSPCCVGQT